MGAKLRSFRIRCTHKRRCVELIQFHASFDEARESLDGLVKQGLKPFSITEIGPAEAMKLGLPVMVREHV